MHPQRSRRAPTREAPLYGRSTSTSPHPTQSETLAISGICHHSMRALVRQSFSLDTSTVPPTRHSRSSTSAAAGAARWVASKPRPFNFVPRQMKKGQSTTCSPRHSLPSPEIFQPQSNTRGQRLEAIRRTVSFDSVTHGNTHLSSPPPPANQPNQPTGMNSEQLPGVRNTHLPRQTPITLTYRRHLPTVHPFFATTRDMGQCFELQRVGFQMNSPAN